MRYYLTFDLGTTALKTALIGEDGSAAGLVCSEYTPCQTAPDRMEMSPHIYWQAVVNSTRQVLAQSEVHPEDLAAIGFSSQGQTFVPLQRDGVPLYNFIVWLDNRAQGIAECWQADWLTPERFRRASGYPVITPELTVFKIAWLQKYVPNTRQAWKFLWLPDAIIYRLTGETVTDWVTARMGGLLDQQTGAWAPDLLDAAGITSAQLPALLAPGDVAGFLRPEAAVELGLPQHIPVCSGANDQLCGALGAGNVQPGMVSETTGTALAVIATTSSLLDDLRLMVGRHAAPGLFYGMAYANTSAVLLTWLRELCGRGGEDYESFLAGAADIPVGCDGLTVLPHFQGAPNCPSGRGAFLGLTLSHTRLHLARAVMEACACLLKECLAPFAEQPAGIARVRTLGGAARSDLWLQIKADLLGVPVERPACQAATSLGAAMLAAVAVGQFACLQEAAASWYRPSAVFTPNLARHAAYLEVYQRYQQYCAMLYSQAR